MVDETCPPSQAETVQEKSARLRAARLDAEKAKDQRIERANRKAAARRKVLGDER